MLFSISSSSHTIPTFIVLTILFYPIAPNLSMIIKFVFTISLGELLYANEI